MYPSLHSIAVLPLLWTLGHAETHDIKVGNKGLNYDPEEVKAAQGDILRFSFYPQEHNVAQGTFDKPCQPMDGGIFSGDIEIENGVSKMTFDVTVNNTDPIWIYCSESGHCNGGMAMVVNGPSDQTLQQYKDAAKSATNADPSAVGGGVFSQAESGSSASSASESTSMAATSATGSAAAAATSNGVDSLGGINNGWLIALGLGGAMAGGLV